MSFRRLAGLTLSLITLTSALQPMRANASTKWTDAELSAPWLGHDTTLQQKHLDKLIVMARQDPAVSNLVDRAFSIVHASDSTQFFSYLRLCNKQRDGDVLGKANLVLVYERANKYDEASANKYKAEIEASLPPNRRIEHWNYTWPLVEYATINRTLCLSRNDNLASIYSAFAHELVHFVDVDDWEDPDHYLDTYSDAQEYINKTLVEKGGEFDAHVVGYGAIIRLVGAKTALSYVQDGVAEKAEPYFDNAGTFRDDKKNDFAKFLLDDREYDKVLGDNYKATLGDGQENILNRTNYLVELYNLSVDHYNKYHDPQENLELDRIQALIQSNGALLKRYKKRIEAP